MGDTLFTVLVVLGLTGGLAGIFLGSFVLISNYSMRKGMKVLKEHPMIIAIGQYLDFIKEMKAAIDELDPLLENNVKAVHSKTAIDPVLLAHSLHKLRILQAQTRAMRGKWEEQQLTSVMEDQYKRLKEWDHEIERVCTRLVEVIQLPQHGPENTQGTQGA